MNTKKPIYRFFSAFLIVAVLSATAVPAGVQGKELVQKLCDMLSGDRIVNMTMNGRCCCSSDQKVSVYTQKTVNSGKQEPCRTVIACACCNSKSPIGSKATPIPQTISSKIAALQVVVVNLMLPTQISVALTNQHIIKASDSSPPIFLKNSSFLN